MKTEERVNTLINPYVTVAAGSVPENEQADLKLELESNIQAIVEDHLAAGKTEEEAVRLTLSEMGDPTILADNFSGKPTALLSGPYYRAFMRLLPKILIGGVLLMIFSSVIMLILQTVAGITVPVYTSGIVVTVLALGGATVLVFALLERNNVTLKSAAWSVDDLARSTPERYIYDRGSEALGFAFSVIFGLLFFFLPGTWTKLMELTQLEIPRPASLDNWSIYSIWILLLIGVTVIEFIFVLIHPYRSYARAWVQIPLNVLAFVAIFKLRQLLLQEPLITDANWSVATFINMTFAVLTFLLLLEIVMAFVRARGYQQYRAMMQA